MSDIVGAARIVVTPDTDAFEAAIQSGVEGGLERSRETLRRFDREVEALNKSLKSTGRTIQREINFSTQITQVGRLTREVATLSREVRDLASDIGTELTRGVRLLDSDIRNTITSARQLNTELGRAVDQAERLSAVDIEIRSDFSSIQRFRSEISDTITETRQLRDELGDLNNTQLRLSSDLTQDLREARLEAQGLSSSLSNLNVDANLDRLLEQLRRASDGALNLAVGLELVEGQARSAAASVAQLNAALQATPTSVSITANVSSVGSGIAQATQGTGQLTSGFLAAAFAARALQGQVDDVSDRTQQVAAIIDDIGEGGIAGGAEGGGGPGDPGAPFTRASVLVRELADNVIDLPSRTGPPLRQVAEQGAEIANTFSEIINLVGDLADATSQTDTQFFASLLDVLNVDPTGLSAVATGLQNTLGVLIEFRTQLAEATSTEDAFITKTLEAAAAVESFDAKFEAESINPSLRSFIRLVRDSTRDLDRLVDVMDKAASKTQELDKVVGSTFTAEDSGAMVAYSEALTRRVQAAVEGTLAPTIDFRRLTAEAAREAGLASPQVDQLVSSFDDLDYTLEGGSVNPSLARFIALLNQSLRAVGRLEDSVDGLNEGFEVTDQLTMFTAEEMLRITDVVGGARSEFAELMDFFLNQKPTALFDNIDIEDLEEMQAVFGDAQIVKDFEAILEARDKVLEAYGQLGTGFVDNLLRGALQQAEKTIDGFLINIFKKLDAAKDELQSRYQGISATTEGFNMARSGDRDISELDSSTDAAEVESTIDELLARVISFKEELESAEVNPEIVKQFADLKEELDRASSASAGVRYELEEIEEQIADYADAQSRVTKLVNDYKKAIAGSSPAIANLVANFLRGDEEGAKLVKTAEELKERLEELQSEDFSSLGLTLDLNEAEDLESTLSSALEVYQLNIRSMSSDLQRYQGILDGVEDATLRTADATDFLTAAVDRLDEIIIELSDDQEMYVGDVPAMVGAFELLEERATEMRDAFQNGNFLNGQLLRDYADTANLLADDLNNLGQMYFRLVLLERAFTEGLGHERVEVERLALSIFSLSAAIQESIEDHYRWTEVGIVTPILEAMAERTATLQQQMSALAPDVGRVTDQLIRSEAALSATGSSVAELLTYIVGLRQEMEDLLFTSQALATDGFLSEDNQPLLVAIGARLLSLFAELKGFDTGTVQSKILLLSDALWTLSNTVAASGEPSPGFVRELGNIEGGIGNLLAKLGTLEQFISSLRYTNGGLEVTVADAERLLLVIEEIERPLRDILTVEGDSVGLLNLRSAAVELLGVLPDLVDHYEKLRDAYTTFFGGQQLFQPATFGEEDLARQREELNDYIATVETLDYQLLNFRRDVEDIPDGLQVSAIEVHRLYVSLLALREGLDAGLSPTDIAARANAVRNLASNIELTESVIRNFQTVPIENIVDSMGDLARLMEGANRSNIFLSSIRREVDDLIRSYDELRDRMDRGLGNLDMGELEVAYRDTIALVAETTRLGRTISNLRDSGQLVGRVFGAMFGSVHTDFQRVVSDIFAVEGALQGLNFRDLVRGLDQLDDLQADLSNLRGAGARIVDPENIALLSEVFVKFRDMKAALTTISESAFLSGQVAPAIREVEQDLNQVVQTLIGLTDTSEAAEVATMSLSDGLTFLIRNLLELLALDADGSFALGSDAFEATSRLLSIGIAVDAVIEKVERLRRALDLEDAFDFTSLSRILSRLQSIVSVDTSGGLRRQLGDLSSLASQFQELGDTNLLVEAVAGISAKLPGASVTVSEFRREVEELRSALSDLSPHMAALLDFAGTVGEVSYADLTDRFTIDMRSASDLFSQRGSQVAEVVRSLIAVTKKFLVATSGSFEPSIAALRETAISIREAASPLPALLDDVSSGLRRVGPAGEDAREQFDRLVPTFEQLVFLLREFDQQATVATATAAGLGGGTTFSDFISLVRETERLLTALANENINLAGRAIQAAAAVDVLAAAFRGLSAFADDPQLDEFIEGLGRLSTEIVASGGNITEFLPLVRRLVTMFSGTPLVMGSDNVGGLLQKLEALTGLNLAGITRSTEDILRLFGTDVVPSQFFGERIAEEAQVAARGTGELASALDLLISKLAALPQQTPGAQQFLAIVQETSTLAAGLRELGMLPDSLYRVKVILDEIKEGGGSQYDDLVGPIQRLVTEYQRFDTTAIDAAEAAKRVEDRIKATARAMVDIPNFSEVLQFGSIMSQVEDLDDALDELDTGRLMEGRAEALTSMNESMDLAIIRARDFASANYLSIRVANALFDSLEHLGTELQHIDDGEFLMRTSPALVEAFAAVAVASENLRDSVTGLRAQLMEVGPVTDVNVRQLRQAAQDVLDTVADARALLAQGLTVGGFGETFDESEAQALRFLGILGQIEDVQQEYIAQLEEAEQQVRRNEQSSNALSLSYGTQTASMAAANAASREARERLEEVDSQGRATASTIDSISAALEEYESTSTSTAESVTDVGSALSRQRSQLDSLRAILDSYGAPGGSEEVYARMRQLEDAIGTGISEILDISEETDVTEPILEQYVALRRRVQSELLEIADQVQSLRSSGTQRVQLGPTGVAALGEDFRAVESSTRASSDALEEWRAAAQAADEEGGELGYGLHGGSLDDDFDFVSAATRRSEEALGSWWENIRRNESALAEFVWSLNELARANERLVILQREVEASQPDLSPTLQVLRDIDDVMEGHSVNPAFETFIELLRQTQDALRNLVFEGKVAIGGLSGLEDGAESVIHVFQQVGDQVREVTSDITEEEFFGFITKLQDALYELLGLVDDEFSYNRVIIPDEVLRGTLEQLKGIFSLFQSGARGFGDLGQEVQGVNSELANTVVLFGQISARIDGLAGSPGRVFESMSERVAELRQELGELIESYSYYEDLSSGVFDPQRAADDFAEIANAVANVRLQFNMMEENSESLNEELSEMEEILESLTFEAMKGEFTIVTRLQEQVRALNEQLEFTQALVDMPASQLIESLESIRDEAKAAIEELEDFTNNDWDYQSAGSLIPGMADFAQEILDAAEEVDLQVTQMIEAIERAEEEAEGLGDISVASAEEVAFLSDQIRSLNREIYEMDRLTRGVNQFGFSTEEPPDLSAIAKSLRAITAEGDRLRREIEDLPADAADAAAALHVELSRMGTYFAEQVETLPSDFIQSLIEATERLQELRAEADEVSTSLDTAALIRFTIKVDEAFRAEPIAVMRHSIQALSSEMKKLAFQTLLPRSSMEFLVTELANIQHRIMDLREVMDRGGQDGSFLNAAALLTKTLSMALKDLQSVARDTSPSLAFLREELEPILYLLTALGQQGPIFEQLPGDSVEKIQALRAHIEDVATVLRIATEEGERFGEHLHDKVSTEKLELLRDTLQEIIRVMLNAENGTGMLGVQFASLFGRVVAASAAVDRLRLLQQGATGTSSDLAVALRMLGLALHSLSLETTDNVQAMNSLLEIGGSELIVLFRGLSSQILQVNPEIARFRTELLSVIDPASAIVWRLEEMRDEIARVRSQADSLNSASIGQFFLTLTEVLSTAGELHRELSGMPTPPFVPDDFRPGFFALLTEEVEVLRQALADVFNLIDVSGPAANQKFESMARSISTAHRMLLQLQASLDSLTVDQVIDALVEIRKQFVHHQEALERLTSRQTETPSLGTERATEEMIRLNQVTSESLGLARQLREELEAREDLASKNLAEIQGELFARQLREELAAREDLAAGNLTAIQEEMRSQEMASRLQRELAEQTAASTRRLEELRAALDDGTRAIGPFAEGVERAADELGGNSLDDEAFSARREIERLRRELDLGESVLRDYAEAVGVDNITLREYTLEIENARQALNRLSLQVETLAIQGKLGERMAAEVREVEYLIHNIIDAVETADRQVSTEDLFDELPEGARESAREIAAILNGLDVGDEFAEAIRIGQAEALTDLDIFGDNLISSLLRVSDGLDDVSFDFDVRSLLGNVDEGSLAIFDALSDRFRNALAALDEGGTAGLGRSLGATFLAQIRDVRFAAIEMAKALSETDAGPLFERLVYLTDEALTSFGDLRIMEQAAADEMRRFTESTHELELALRVLGDISPHAIAPLLEDMRRMAEDGRTDIYLVDELRQRLIDIGFDPGLVESTNLVSAVLAHATQAAVDLAEEAIDADAALLGVFRTLASQPGGGEMLLQFTDIGKDLAAVPIEFGPRVIEKYTLAVGEAARNVSALVNEINLLSSFKSLPPEMRTTLDAYRVTLRAATSDAEELIRSLVPLDTADEIIGGLLPRRDLEAFFPGEIQLIDEIDRLRRSLTDSDEALASNLPALHDMGEAAAAVGNSVSAGDVMLQGWVKTIEQAAAVASALAYILHGGSLDDDFDFVDAATRRSKESLDDWYESLRSGIGLTEQFSESLQGLLQRFAALVARASSAQANVGKMPGDIPGFDGYGVFPDEEEAIDRAVQQTELGGFSVQIDRLIDLMIQLRQETGLTFSDLRALGMAVDPSVRDRFDLVSAGAESLGKEARRLHRELYALDVVSTNLSSRMYSLYNDIADNGRETEKFSRGIDFMGKVTESFSRKIPDITSALLPYQGALTKADDTSDSFARGLRTLLAAGQNLPGVITRMSNGLIEVAASADIYEAAAREITESTSRFADQVFRADDELTGHTLLDSLKVVAAAMGIYGRETAKATADTSRLADEVDELDRDLLDVGDSGGRGRRGLRDFGDGLDDVGRRSQATSNKLGQLFRQVAAGFGFREAFRFFQESIDAVSSLEEATSKTEVVFGDAAASVKAFAEGAVESFGQSNAQALEAISTYGNLLTSFGLTQEAAAGMSINLDALASDLASFNNIPIEQALQALTSGLSGEIEPVRRLGISINETRLEQEALALGFKKTGDTLDPAVKALAAYKIIMEDTTNAQGDFARTSDQLANQQRILQAEIAEARVEIGEGLLPVAKEVVTAIREILPSLVELGTSLASVAADVATGFLPVIEAVSVLAQGLAVVIDKLPSPITATTVAFIALVAVLNEGFVSGLRNTITFLGALPGQLLATRSALGGTTAALQATEAAAVGAGASFSALGTVLPIVGALLVAGITIYGLFNKTAEATADGVDVLTEALLADNEALVAHAAASEDADAALAALDFEIGAQRAQQIADALFEDVDAVTEFGNAVAGLDDKQIPFEQFLSAIEEGATFEMRVESGDVERNLETLPLSVRQFRLALLGAGQDYDDFVTDIQESQTQLGNIVDLGGLTDDERRKLFEVINEEDVARQDELLADLDESTRESIESFLLLGETASNTGSGFAEFLESFTGGDIERELIPQFAALSEQFNTLIKDQKVAAGLARIDTQAKIDQAVQTRNLIGSQAALIERGLELGLSQAQVEQALGLTGDTTVDLSNAMNLLEGGLEDVVLESSGAADAIARLEDEMKSAESVANSFVPDISEGFSLARDAFEESRDAQTEALNVQKESLSQQREAAQESAEAAQQAAEDQVAAIEAQAEAIRAFNESEQERIDAIRESEEEAQAFYSQAISDAEAFSSAIADASTRAGDALTEQRERLEKLKTGYEEARAEVEENFKFTKNQAEFEAILAEFNRLSDAIVGVEEDIEGLPDEAEASLADMNAVIRQQVTDTSNFIRNIRALLARGADDTAKFFLSQGESAAGLAAEAAGLNDAQLADQEAFLEKQQALNASQIAGITELIDSVDGIETPDFSPLPEPEIPEVGDFTAAVDDLVDSIDARIEALEETQPVLDFSSAVAAITQQQEEASTFFSNIQLLRDNDLSDLANFFASQGVEGADALQSLIDTHALTLTEEEGFTDAQLSEMNERAGDIFEVQNGLLSQAEEFAREFTAAGGLAGADYMLQLAEAIGDNQDVVSTALEEALGKEVTGPLVEQLAQTIATARGVLALGATNRADVERILTQFGSDRASIEQVIKLLGFATGGIFDQPTLGIMGEDGKEVLLPLTQPQRALRLAKQSGLFGVLAKAQGAGGTVSSAPVGQVGLGGTNVTIQNLNVIVQAAPGMDQAEARRLGEEAAQAAKRRLLEEVYGS